MFDEKEYQKEYQKDNPGKHRERQERWQKKNPQYAKQWLKDNPEYKKQWAYTLRGRFTEYRRGAKKRGLIFEPTFDEFVKILSNPCHYCGGESYGIDRLDSSIGYSKDNIVSCCSMCNLMKRTYTEEDFIKQCKKIINNIERRIKNG